MKRNGRKSLAGALARAKNESGFTLVELIVVIAILGILAGVGTVGYSGYIKKANMAADQQLLVAINQAYAAACIENGNDSKQVTAKSITIGDDKVISKIDIKVTNPSAKSTDIQNAFEKYFAGNEGSEFKVFTTLTYDKNAGGFKHAVLSDIYAALLNTFSQDDIDALNESTFGEMGVVELLGAVDLASNVANELLNSDDPDERMVALINSDENWDNLVSCLGFTSDTDEGFDDAYIALIEKKAAQLAADPAYAGKSDMELKLLAENAIMTNSAVFSVATNASFDKDAFAIKLADGTAKQAIKDNLAEGGDLEAGLSQAALTYALYTAYAEKNGIAMSQENALGSVLDALGDENFKAYAANASADIAGYQAAMNMMNDSSGNTDVATDLLLNGFNNGDLMVLLQSTIG